MSQNLKRNHHFVPKCLLRHWCDEKGMLWQYDTQINSVEQKHKDAAGMQRDGYALFTESREPDFETIENYLQNVENDASPVILHLLNRKRELATSSIRKFILFVSVQYLRTPSMLSRIKQIDDPELALSDLIKIMCDNIRIKLSARDFSKDVIETEIAQAKLAAESRLFAKDLHKIASFRQVKNAFIEFTKMKWCFLCVPDNDPELLIGDHPVLLNDSGPMEGWPRPLGLNNPFLQVFMPLSPRMVALAGYNVECSYGILGTETADLINDLTLQFSRRYVYGRMLDHSILARAVKLNGTGPQIRVRALYSDDNLLMQRHEFW